ncbi:MAG: ABC transporter ATP-binding protein [Levilactobacillus sp.]|jgi:ABC-type nitrate/sulfonate/bicarbonate transport system ATPase subunit|uniref:ABC transporter ATP-binding protein n=1 Tax=Levilactobacillus sp. TaxID=2767919 RepID=UPI00258D056F|nr:ABC transporter ATP-binding protein [Levilactobacillus sp.]MCI1553478.1 ABC transporter ATP-binding protein [Levilactobacillus sp.]MCI1597867.1 ABC transporter ATP-binding protein [Levilactobacillus sp.]MCI1606206.1 ABC transporter ATP-binding protein [Levilactobacillus sp.]
MTITLTHVGLTLDDLEILRDVTATITDGSFVSLIAPSGAGKSTLLKLLTGLLTPTTGTLQVAGQPITGLNTTFSYLPQTDMLLPWYDVDQNITLYQRINHQPIDHDYVTALLTLFGLVDYRHFLPHQLSGGMRQRVALLRTMLNPADYRLLDEPFGALDAMTRGLMQDWLLSLPADLQKTTLLVTHDIEEAIYLSDRILVLSARPAHVIRDIALTPTHRDRQWLATQAPLKAEIYELLRSAESTSMS